MDNQNQKPTVTTEEIKISGDALMAKVKELLHEGNIRQISIRDKEGQTLLVLPMNVGVAGAAALVFFMPVLAAVGALAALVAEVTIVIERVGE